MNNIYLIGMPGCGKSTIGVNLSKLLKMDFVDTDNYIVEKEKHTIPDIFKNRGEMHFRKLETKYLNEISKGENKIVSTGGGIIKTEENITLMKNTGEIIFIDTPIQNILKNSSLSGRPLLDGNKNKIYNLYEERYEKYKQSADFIYLNVNTLNEAVDEIYILLKKGEQK